MKTIALFLFGMTLLINSCVVVGLRPYKQYRQAKELQPFDAIIVPGIPYEAKSPWKYYMKKRVLWSVFLYKQGITKRIIYSGGAVYTPFPEAKVMGLYARKLGVPDTAILYDTVAQHGVENVYFSYELARQHGFKNIALATDQAQTYFLANFIRRFNKVYKLPALNRYVYTFSHEYPVIDTSSLRVADFQPITKRFTKKQLKERSMGGNINQYFTINGDPISL